jgi:hypothetical protein
MGILMQCWSMYWSLLSVFYMGCFIVSVFSVLGVHLYVDLQTVCPMAKHHRFKTQGTKT